MKYMVFGFGSYDVDDEDVYGISTMEEAEWILHKKVTAWCREHNIRPKDIDYEKGDDSFYIGRCEEGICSYKIYEVPDFHDEVHELMWKAQFEMDKACYEADDYAFTLQDNCVNDYAYRAKELIDEAINLMYK